MPLSEVLQVQLPRAIDIGGTSVASRQWDLTLYPKATNYYSRLTITRLRGTPAFAPFQVWVYRNDVELGQYASQGGTVELDIEVTNSVPVLLRLFNLSIDTEVMVSVLMNGWLYNAV